MDQYKHQKEYIKTVTTTSTGFLSTFGIRSKTIVSVHETVLVDPETTMQRMTLVFVWFINLATFVSIATTVGKETVTTGRPC